jgi:DNA-binding response OmpR family regulator
VSRILVIDDDVASCRTIALHLGRDGHEVRVAHRFEDGLAAARADAPQLIILDIRMPGGSGLEGLPQLKREFPGARIIMITAFDDRDTRLQAMERGADDYIAKPVDLNALDAAVAKADPSGSR